MRVVVADDSALIRDGLRHLLPAHGIEVAATAADTTELFAAVEQTHPDVALIDIRMPPTHTIEGLTAARTIRNRLPDVGVLILSQHVEADYALQLLLGQPGRSGYLLKERLTQTETLLDAIDRVAHGETVIDRELVDLLLSKRPSQSALDDLTQREREVLTLVAEGLTDRGIAERLWLTPKTVETHVRHILAKLGIPPDIHHNRRVLAVLSYLRSGATL